MATNLFTRCRLLSKPPQHALVSLLARSLSFAASAPAPAPRTSFSFSSLFLRHGLRPLAAACTDLGVRGTAFSASRTFATRTTSSSLNDPNPNWSNRPPKETILLDGCDFEHWLVVMEKPEGDVTRDEIIDSYIKTLAMVVGSEEEARMKIYSVSTRHYYAFGALVPEELSYKIKELPRVRWVLPDSYLDVKNKDYGGEPFINGQAVPYDPKYHEEWVRNNARANERNRRNDRPRNFDRSRNFERRRENMQNRDFQNAPMPNQGPPNQANIPANNMGGGVPPNNFNRMPPNNQGGPSGNFGGMPPSNPGGMPPNNFAGLPLNQGGMPPSNPGGMPPNNFAGMPPNHVGMPPSNPGGMPPNNFAGMPPNQGGMAPSNYGGMAPNQGQMPPNNQGGMPPSNYGGMAPNNQGQMPPNNFGVMPPHNMGGMPPQNNMGGMPPQSNMGGYSQNQGWCNTTTQRDSGNPPNYQSQNFSPTRDPINVPGGNAY